VPSYEFYGSLFKEKQLVRVMDVKAAMHRNALNYLENLQKINNVEKLVEQRGGYEVVSAICIRAELFGNHKPHPLPIMRDVFIKKCLFILHRGKLIEEIS
jgi:hypothetical protein